jgi:hypothetical protein
VDLGFHKGCGGPAKQQGYAPRGTVAMLGDEDVGNPPPLSILVVDFIAVDEKDYVSVLLDAARLSQIRQNRALVAARFYAAGELR